MTILQVNTYDLAGGAEKIAYTLHEQYQQQHHHAFLAVGYKRSQAPNIFSIPHEMYQGRWERTWNRLAQSLSPFIWKIRGVKQMYHLCCQLRELPHSWRITLGHEDFYFPGTRHLLEIPPTKPALVHAHNLHGNYFDLRVLPWLSSQLPVILTLHDAWLLSGHCAHSFDCERWKIGCGQCPDLSIYPAIHRDATTYNWRRKQTIYTKSQLYVSTPSHWLMRKVEQSMLSQAIVSKKVIPNGIDLSLFHPADKITVRQKLGIPLDTDVCLFVAHGIHQNRWKDSQLLQTVIIKVANSRESKKNCLFIALGATEKEDYMEHYGRAKFRFVPFEKETASVTNYYQAADIYVHAARVDTFPTTILEALACGIPVVATAVGGIPEQIEQGNTGFLIPPGNSEAMAAAIQELLYNHKRCHDMGIQAAKMARERFDVKRMIADYLTWYEEILNNSSKTSLCPYGQTDELRR
ncbi:glycosyl transferase-like protein [Candidatus Vecturithrix granuli]|uniref:Glycosyl transferase-like protein n=1 Tax=Vecturithrix granuli TaxID=1499967 RepID=A0A0S6W6M2_VECG1|nr:glycosyl transferase-like protein [Candidatus Vecturithrix granuli]